MSRRIILGASRILTGSDVCEWIHPPTLQLCELKFLSRGKRKGLFDNTLEYLYPICRLNI